MKEAAQCLNGPAGYGVIFQTHKSVAPAFYPRLKKLARDAPCHYKRAMSDKIFYPFAALVAIALIALSLVWPQGLGQVSPKPFGHPVIMPDYFRMVRERDARKARETAEKAAARQRAADSSSASASSSH
jgi:hypothetical protein